MLLQVFLLALLLVAPVCGNTSLNEDVAHGFSITSDVRPFHLAVWAVWVTYSMFVTRAGMFAVQPTFSNFFSVQQCLSLLACVCVYVAATPVPSTASSLTSVPVVIAPTQDSAERSTPDV